MYDDCKKQMEMISGYAGACPAYVQGGGGNTSVKFDERLMAIKASGYTLAQITAEKGYVTVDYSKIREYYNTVDPNAGRDFEKESLSVNLGSIVLLSGMEEKRPSVEVGFHSFLSRCVIHTHSVYANLLCCSVEGQSIAEEVFAGSGITYLFIPYIDPGFRLTLAIRRALAFETKSGCSPDALFLENHGVIVHNESASKAIAIHEEVNNRIKEYFKLPDFPDPRIKKTADAYMNDTAYLMEFIAQNKAYEEYFNLLKLYPDQLVYLGGKMGNQIQINRDSGDLTYFSGEKEALAMHETLLGAAFVIDLIKKAGLTLRQMDEAGAAFINNWESEKYRSNLMK